MFNKEERVGNLREVETIIGPSVKVKGEFNGNGNIIVEGMFEGSLKTTNSLYIGDKASVTANMEAKEVTIGGVVIGNIKVQGHLEITSTAKISGDIESASLSIAKGAFLNGKCVMTKQAEGSQKIIK